MTTPLLVFLIMIGCLVATAVIFFGLSMLLRRASRTYAFLTGAFALLPIVGCAENYVTNDSLFGSLSPMWGLILVIVPVILYVQARSLKLSWPAAIAGFLGDLGLSAIWLFPLMFVEMILTGDGGPGFGQYALVTLLTFFGVELILPVLIERGMSNEPNAPPRVSTPGEYPRP